LKWIIFFRRRDEISIPRERGDRLRISNTDGSPANCIQDFDDTFSINPEAVGRIEKFILLLSEFTSWNYKKELWTWDKFVLKRFTKKDIKGQGKRLNGNTFKEMLDLKPISWAMTSGDNIEFTLEEPDNLE